MKCSRRILTNGLLLLVGAAIALTGGCAEPRPEPGEVEVRALLQAVEDGDKNTVDKLIKANSVLVNWRMDNGEQPLHIAAFHGQHEVARILLLRGANINAKDDEGKMALHVANVDACYEVVKLLLANGAIINAKDKDSRTPLHAAVMGASLNVCKLLVENHANVNAADDKGWTSLHRAAFEGRSDIVKLLLDNEANPKARTLSYCTFGPTDEETKKYIGETSVQSHSTPLEAALEAKRNPKPVIWLAQSGSLSHEEVTSSQPGRWDEVIALLGGDGEEE